MLKKLLISMVTFAITLSTKVVASPNLNASTLNEMESIRSEYNLPSLSVAIGIKDEIVFAQAIGYADINNSRLASKDTQYSIGSLAKPMTGLALASLIDSEKISLKSPVSSYVKTPKYTELFNVEELAAHLAGIPHDTPERNIAEFEEVKDHKKPIDAFYVFDKHPLLFEPGTDYKYSSNGYILLSAVVEAAANTDFVGFLQQSLWSKFGMENTELDTSVAGLKNEAMYYSDYSKNGTYIESVKHRDRSFLFGGGGFISTPSDLVKMAQATYDNSYLSYKVKKLLVTPIKMRNGKVNSENYSLGWRVGKIKLMDTEKRKRTVLHHGGVTDRASNAYLLVIPECKASIAFATNYVPNNFWRIRGRMAKLLISNIDANTCLN